MDHTASTSRSPQEMLATHPSGNNNETWDGPLATAIAESVQDALLKAAVPATDETYHISLQSEDSARRLAELASIVESSDDAILTKDLTGIIKTWNKGATRIFGYTPDEIVGTSILRLIPPNLHAEETTILQKIRSGDRIDHYETIRVAKDGRHIHASLSISPVRDESGTVVGAAKILRDISDRKRIEASLIQAEKIAHAGRMAATIAHEINNPLEAVVNLLYLAKASVTDPAVLSLLATAEGEIARVSNIARQTLGFYRERNAAVALSIADIITDAALIYEPRCNAGRIVINTNLHSAQRLVVRRGEIMQAISNLIANSIYAMPAGGTLNLGLKDTVDPSPGVLLTVEDTGSGIPEDHIPRIFEAFYTTRETTGTGIGLFVTRELVEGHGGTITVRSSVAPHSHGTTMSIFLPADNAYSPADGTAS